MALTILRVYLLPPAVRSVSRHRLPIINRCDCLFHLVSFHGAIKNGSSSGNSMHECNCRLFIFCPIHVINGGFRAKISLDNTFYIKPVFTMTHFNRHSFCDLNNHSHTHKVRECKKATERNKDYICDKSPHGNTSVFSS